MLTYDEFTLLGYEMNEEDFYKFLPRATSVLHSLTRRFYVYTEISEDVKWRRDAFKQALSEQVYYFHETGGTTQYSLNKPSSVSIGRTSVSTGGSGGTSGVSIYSSDAIRLLEDTGLLYRGVVTR